MSSDLGDRRISPAARHTAILSARRDAGGDLVHVALDVDDEVCRRYTAPGQYVEIVTDAGNGYFVLASDVGVTPFELLVKNAGDAADALFTRPIGSTVTFDGPLGEGFPFARLGGGHLVIAVVGSALAVARPVLKHRIEGGVAAATHLFLGLRTPLDLPIPSEVAAWVASGVVVVLCLSRAELHHHEEVLPGAQRSVGYVQRALERALRDRTVPHGSLVIAAGPQELLSDMRALALDRSIAATATHLAPAIEVLTNV